jgi:hypothetical protein
MKKGDLSINIIVVAAIAMLILVIISVLVFRAGDGIVGGTSCDGLGDNIQAECVPSNFDCSDMNGIVNRGARCQTSGYVCCVLSTGN